MLKTLTTAAMLAGFLAAAPAFAAGMTSAQQCTALQKQFDTAITTHATDAKAKTASALRTDGGKLCASKQASKGVKKLEEALNDIGVKPTN